MSEKMKKKKELEISSFYTLYQKLWSHDARWTDRCMDGQIDRQTDRQKKWHIEVGAPPKNNPQLIEAKIKIRKLMDVNI